MAEQGGLISPEDFTSLKKLINTEITRRSNANSSGSISTYKGTSWQFSETPANGKFITYEHIQKITTPLNAIDGNTPTPDKESLVYAQTLKDCLVKINDLSSKSLTGSSSGCRSSCTGLCSSACYSGCSGCRDSAQRLIMGAKITTTGVLFRKAEIKAMVGNIRNCALIHSA